MKRVTVTVTNDEEFICESCPDPEEFGGDSMMAPEGDCNLEGPPLGDGFVFWVPDDKVEKCRSVMEEWGKECGYTYRLDIEEDGIKQRLGRLVGLAATKLGKSKTLLMAEWNLGSTVYSKDKVTKGVRDETLRKIADGVGTTPLNCWNYLHQGLI